MRYMRRLRQLQALAEERRRLVRAAARPLPKRIRHIEDTLYENGLRFVRPGAGDRIFGAGLPREGVTVNKV